MVLLGGFIELDMVWIIADIRQCLDGSAKLDCSLSLSPVVIAETKSIFKNLIRVRDKIFQSYKIVRKMREM